MTTHAPYVARRAALANRVALLPLIAALAACGPSATPTLEPTSTPLPTMTPTAYPTISPIPTATAEPTITPVWTTPSSGVDSQLSMVPALLPPQEQAKPLKVEFTDLHYECQKSCNSDFFGRNAWSYRSFQVLMKVENVSRDLTLAGGTTEREGWAPTAWILTDGAREWTDDYAWQWAMGPRHLHGRPDLPPGAKSEWTWMAEPVPYGAWVKAVEYVDPWGNVYRQDFPKPDAGQLNYVDCGEPREGDC